MRKTSLDDWQIIRKEPAKPFLTHCIYESDNTEFAFYFSRIEEWGILKYCSKLQIYRDKSSPQKIYDSESVWFLFNPFTETDFIYDWTHEKLICFRQLISPGHNKHTYPFIIIDLENLKYTLIKDKLFATLTKNEDNSIICTETIIDKTNNTEKKMEGIFNLDEMKWFLLVELTG